MFHKGAVAGIAKLTRRGVWGQQAHVVSRLRWWAKSPHRVRRIDDADLLCPEVVFRHEGKAPKSAQPPGCSDPPAGFFKHFAMQCRQGGFTGIDTATGQLDLWLRFGLMGQQQPSTKR